MRTVILHYHIYKNAGTSFDHVLAHNFGDRHEAFDGPYPFFTIDQEQLDRIITRRPGAVAFSSHQIALPPPSSVAYRTLAAIFVRNPFLRIASIYRFKRGPEADDGTPLALLPHEQRVEILTARGDYVELADHVDTTTTAQVAQRQGFGEWLEHCLDDKAEMVHVSNAQTRFFAGAYRQRPALKRTARAISYDLSTALRNLAGVELLGRTEHFEDDVTRFGQILAAEGLSLALPDDTRKNVTDHGSRSTVERVETLLSDLPPSLRERIETANQQDIALYDRACELIERDHRV